ncbi:MAG: hypothetical protein ACRC5C_10615, partial [Bacilli bacterium]
MLLNSLDKINEKYDFTDSIITMVKWGDNLLDLVVTVDYYWDIQEGKTETRLLNIIFKNCLSSKFTTIPKNIPLNTDEKYLFSFFTIILFKEFKASAAIYDKHKFIK